MTKRTGLALTLLFALSGRAAAAVVGAPPVVVLAGFTTGTAHTTLPGVTQDMATRYFPTLWTDSSYGAFRPTVTSTYGWLEVPAGTWCGQSITEDPTFGQAVERAALAAGVVFPNGVIPVVIAPECGHVENRFISSLPNTYNGFGIFSDGKLLNESLGEILGLPIAHAINTPMNPVNNWDPFTPMGFTDQPRRTSGIETLQLGWITNAHVFTGSGTHIIEALEVPPTTATKLWFVQGTGVTVDARQMGGTVVPFIHAGHAILDLEPTSGNQYALPPGQIFAVNGVGIRNDGASATAVIITTFPYTGSSTVTCVGGEGSFCAKSSGGTTAPPPPQKAPPPPAPAPCPKGTVCQPATTPNASFTASPTSALVNQAVTFDGSASSAGTGHTLVSYAWDFGDGATATGVTATHAFAAAGSFVISLTVMDEIGQTASTTRTEVVSTAPPPPPPGGTPPKCLSPGIAINVDDLYVCFVPNSGDGGTLAGIRSLTHRLLPSVNAFTFGAINPEHIEPEHYQGSLAVENGFFSPRYGAFTLTQVDAQTVRWDRPASADAYWPVAWTMFARVSGHAVDFSYTITVEDATPFGPEFGLGLFFANYMSRMGEVALHFIGIPYAGASEQWIVANPPYPGGGYASAAWVPDATRVNQPPAEWPKFTQPFYASQSNNGMMFCLVFDRTTETEPVMMKWVIKDETQPSQWLPALDWMTWFPHVETGGAYTVKQRLLWFPSTRYDDCRDAALAWVP